MDELTAVREVLREEAKIRNLKHATLSKRAGLGKNTGQLLIEKGKTVQAETLVRLVRDGLGMELDTFAYRVERKLAGGAP